jgi:hypothetical protein
VPGGGQFLQPQQVVDPLDPLQRPGSGREPPWLAVVTDANPAGIAAPLLRARRLGDPRAPGDRQWVEAHRGADGGAGWMDGHSGIGIAGTSAHMGWRHTMLDADELTTAVEAFIASADRFAPPE